MVDHTARAPARERESERARKRARERGIKTFSHAETSAEYVTVSAFSPACMQAGFRV